MAWRLCIKNPRRLVKSAVAEQFNSAVADGCLSFCVSVGNYQIDWQSMVEENEIVFISLKSSSVVFVIVVFAIVSVVLVDQSRLRN